MVLIEKKQLAFKNIMFWKESLCLTSLFQVFSYVSIKWIDYIKMDNSLG